MKNAVTVILSLSLVAGSAFASSERATPEEAKSMVKKALNFYKSNGKDKTFAALNDPKGQFIDRDLYVFVHDDKGIYYAIAPKPAFIGKDMSSVRDANGKFIVKEQIEVLAKQDSMWQEYDWQSPATNKIERKKTYCEKVSDKGESFHFCSGAYTQ